MNTKTPMALDEVLAVMDETIHCSDEEHMGLLGPELHQMLERARATIAALQSAHAEEVAGLRDTLLRNGLVPCDSPGCMCGDWHHRYGWPERFREFTEALENAGHPLTNANGNLALNALSELVRRAEQAEARLAESDKAIDELTAALSEADNENAELEARLARVEALPAQWRADALTLGESDAYGLQLDQCADDVDAALAAAVAPVGVGE